MSDNTVHLLSKEQYDMLSSDLAALIGRVDESLASAKKLNERAEQTQKDLKESYDLDGLKALQGDMISMLESIREEKVSMGKMFEKVSSLHGEIDAKNKALLDEVETRINQTMGGVSSHIKRAVHEAVKDVPVILDTDSLKDEMKHHVEVAFRDSNMGQTLQTMEAFGKVADRHIPKLTITVNEIEKVNAKLDKNSKNIQNMPAWINKATNEVRVAAKDLRENSQSIKKSVSSLNLALPIFTLIVGALSTFIVLEYGDKIATLIKAGVGSLIG